MMAPRSVRHGENGVVDRLFCAIDTADAKTADQLARQLGDSIGGYKLGLEFMLAHGLAGVEAMAAHRRPIMLDVKLNEIPRITSHAVRALCETGAFLITVHALGGPAMMRSAMGAALRVGDQTGVRPKVVAVTILTTMEQEELGAAGFSGTINDHVRRLADLAQTSGLDGAWTSARDVGLLRAQCGPDFLLVVPGIRPAWSPSDDQAHILTPGDAIRQGADYLVVGRPITRANDPLDAARRIAEEARSAAT